MWKRAFWGVIILAIGISNLKETDAAIPHKEAYAPRHVPAQLPFKVKDLEVSIGYAHAPLTIVMYYSLACPHCHEFQEKILPQIREEYIDKNLVRFVYRDFPTNQFALQAAKIAWCHGKAHYLAIAQKLLATQDKWVPESLKGVKEAEEALRNIALECGITEENYQKCLNDQDTEEVITTSSFELMKTHPEIKGAPAFIINNEVFDGDLTAEYIHTRLLKMGIHG